MTDGWLVLYDGDCGFCKALLAPLLAWDRAGRLQPLALQTARARSLLADLTDAQRLASWHLIAPDGTRFSAGAALPPLLRLLPAAAPLARLLGAGPGPALTERGYRWVAGHRAQLSRAIPARAKRRAAAYVSRREAACAAGRSERAGRCRSG